MKREESFAWGRLLWRAGRRPERVITEPPQKPVGAKLEITYACNLRCGFCYTDSPRRTLQRSIDLSDEDWKRVVRECLEIGIVEAVVTGGEPLLRKDLTLGLIETLASEGVGVTLNTNGWFVDDEVADRLRDLPGVTAHISLDGARSGLHDSSRGVPGSWRRAVEGIDRLLSAGVGVCVVHVVTPANAAAVPEFLEQMWALGVPWVRVTPVVQTGAAARGGKWDVSRKRLQAAVDAFRRRRGEAMKVELLAGTGGGLALQGKLAPASFLVRPNGDVRPDSLRPFTFGNAARDGVAACWESLRAGWNDQRIEKWAGSLGGSGDLPESDLIAYLDDEIPIAEGAVPERHSGRGDPVPEPAPLKPISAQEDLAQAKEMVRGLAMARRYDLAPLRWSGGPEERFVRRASDGRYLKMNGSSGLVMDALEGGTISDAAEALERRYGIAAEQAREDATAATRELIARRVVIAAGGSGEAFLAEPGTSDLAGLEVGEQG